MISDRPVDGVAMLDLLMVSHWCSISDNLITCSDFATGQSKELMGRQLRMCRTAHATIAQ
jgi:hypothetical protein